MALPGRVASRRSGWLAAFGGASASFSVTGVHQDNGQRVQVSFLFHPLYAPVTREVLYILLTCACGAGEESPTPATDHCSNGAGFGGFGPFLGASALLLLGSVYMGIRWRYSRSCIELLANSRACTLARSKAACTLALLSAPRCRQLTTICGSTW